MKLETSLQDCLAQWQKENARSFEAGEEELLALLEGRMEDAPLDRLLRHLCYSPEERHRLFEMERFTARQSRIEVALSKAAADAAPPESFTITTEGQRYQLIFRRLLAKDNEGVLTLKAAPHLKEELDNHQVLVMDAAGQEILRGRMESGELSGRIKNPGKIQWQTLLIKEEEA